MAWWPSPPLNREETIQALRAAAARGCKGGQCRKLSEDDLMVAQALKDRSIPGAQIAARLGMGRATVYACFPQAVTRSLA